MKITKFFMITLLGAVLSSCNSGTPTGDPPSNTTPQDETRNPDVGSEEMNHHHATDSMGEKTTGGH